MNKITNFLLRNKMTIGVVVVIAIILGVVYFYMNKMERFTNKSGPGTNVLRNGESISKGEFITDHVDVSLKIYESELAAGATFESGDLVLQKQDNETHHFLYKLLAKNVESLYVSNNKPQVLIKKTDGSEQVLFDFSEKYGNVAGEFGFFATADGLQFVRFDYVPPI